MRFFLRAHPRLASPHTMPQDLERDKQTTRKRPRASKRVIEPLVFVRDSIRWPQCAERGENHHPSPAAHHSSRCVIVDDLSHQSSREEYDVIISSGCDVLRVTVDLTADTSTSVERGKERALRPGRVSGTSETTTIGRASARREIQALNASDDGLRLYAVDDHGVMDCWTRDGEDGGAWRATASGTGSSDVAGVGGWCGVFPLGDDGRVVVAKSASRTLDVYDGDRRVRRMNTLLRPYDAATTASVGGDGRVLCVAEGHHLAVYDDRVAERGGCANRIPLGYNKPLFAVSASKAHGKEHVVACGGEERVVHVLDVRKWGCTQRWRNAVKFDITQIELSATAPEFAYVAGLDYECMCGDWQAMDASGGFSFRADSRWMGLASRPTASGCDVLAGWAESGAVYALRARPESE